MWQSIPSQNPNAPSRALEDAALVITPTDSLLHTLNETAAFVWTRAQGEKSLETILQELMGVFDVDEQEARLDVEAFVHEAVQKGMLILTDPQMEKDTADVP
jgi:hypothetical protein